MFIIVNHYKSSYGVKLVCHTISPYPRQLVLRFYSCHVSPLIFFLSFFSSFFLTRTQRLFYYSIVWGIVYNRGMRDRGTLRPLNKLALPQSLRQATPLKFYVYIVNFFREVCNTPCIMYQLIYIS